MKIAICDDSSFDRELIVDLLKEYFENKFIKPDFTEYSNGVNLIYDIEEGANYDILFLDIYMANMNGIEVAKKLREIHFNGKIVFLTATPDFVFSGYDVGAVDYLLKHKGIKSLNDVMDKIVADSNLSSGYDKLYKIVKIVLINNVTDKEYFNVDNNVEQLHKTIKKVLKDNNIYDAESLFSSNNDKKLCHIIKSILKSYCIDELKVLEDNSSEKFDRSMNRILKSYDVSVYHIKYRNQFISVPYYEIMYIESINSKCIMHCTDKKEYTIYKKLDEIESELASRRFLRCHQSYLVNMDYVKQVDKQFIMSNGDIVSIRQRNLKALKQVYLDYIDNKKSS